MRISRASVVLNIYLSLLLAFANVSPSFAAAQSDEVTQDSELQIAALTRDILLKGIDLSRFLLHYRIESARQPKTRLLRYFLAQEASSSCALAFEILATRQFGNNQSTPLRIDKPLIHRAFNTVLVGSIIGGSSSAVELGSNAMRELRNRRHGMNSGAAIKHYVDGLHEMDAMLDKREQLVTHQTGETKQLFMLEGKLLREFRERSIVEFLTFHQDTVGIKTFENTYYFLNTGTNAVAASSIVYGDRSLRNIQYTAPSNILFLISGAMTMTSPSIAIGACRVARGMAKRSLLKKLGLDEMPVLDDTQLEADLNRFAAMGQEVGARHPSIGVQAERALGVYSQADQRFTSLLDYESKRIRLLRTVAVQNMFLAPAIGATLTAQGILGTFGYYHYDRPPFRLDKFRAADRINYAGSIAGLTGTATAVGGNALLLAAALTYREHLRRNNRLPEQLVNSRLASLDDIEKEVKQIAPAQ
ncbi:MAG TPA: hypothetical protein V6C97_26100 [Oculatellaceae cyanobacterium]